MMANEAVDNSLGTLAVTDINRLRRLLSIGCENGTYSVGEKDFGLESAQCIFRLIEGGKGEEVVREILAFSTEGKASKANVVLFALAFCARVSTDLPTKQAAYKALGDVCRIPTQLFHFVDYAERLSGKTTGWGRAQRKAVSEWYNAKSPEELAPLVTKYISRNGWSHTDLLRLAHVKPKNDASALVLKYVVKGFEEAKKEYSSDNISPEMQQVLRYLEAVNVVKHSQDEQQVARLVEEFRLSCEHIPTGLFNSKEMDIRIVGLGCHFGDLSCLEKDMWEWASLHNTVITIKTYAFQEFITLGVWRALLRHMPLVPLIQNIGKMTSLGILEPLSSDGMAPFIIERLKNELEIGESRIHPFAVLQALKTYEQGKADKGKLKWVPNGAVADALNTAFHLSFKNVQPTTKRHLLAVDLNSAATFGTVNGSPQLRPVMAIAAMAMVTARSEQDYQMVGFSQTMVPVRLSAQMSLPEVMQAIGEVPAIPVKTDPSLPILWALQEKKMVDVFVVYSDKEMTLGAIPPAHAIQQYRKEMGIPHAKLAVCGLSTSLFALANTTDAGMLDMIGFDTAAPRVLRSFISGEL